MIKGNLLKLVSKLTRHEKNRIIRSLTFSAGVFYTAFCQEYKALEGLEAVKSVIDFRKDDPKEVATYLTYLYQTYKYLNIRFSDNADFVIVFTGPVVKLSSTSRVLSSNVDSNILDQIAETVASMENDRIRMEVCLFA